MYYNMRPNGEQEDELGDCDEYRVALSAATAAATGKGSGSAGRNLKISHHQRTTENIYIMEILYCPSVRDDGVRSVVVQVAELTGRESQVADRGAR